DDLEGLLKLLDELVVLAVAPGLAEPHELAVEHGHLVEQFVVELLEIHGEPPELPRVDDRLRHGTPFPATESWRRSPRARPGRHDGEIDGTWIIHRSRRRGPSKGKAAGRR